MNKKLNLKQVSQQLGVSTATVSNAFNRPDQLSAKLRERILRESAELGYHGPNFAARSLRKGASDVVAVVLADSISYSLSDPVASQFLQGVAEVLGENKKQLLLLSSESDELEQSSAESLPDGFIFYGAPSGDIFERVSRSGKPIIAVDFETHDSESVNINNEEGAFSVASHALANKPKHAAVLGLRLVDSQRICRLTAQDMSVESKEISRSRLKGYLRAFEEQQLAISPSHVWHIPLNTPEMAEIAAKEALTLNPLPEVILCMSDVIALGVLRVANELNIAIPQQVKVTGFDDIPEAQRSSPGLTTVCQQSSEKGRVATRLLLNNESKDSVILDTRLVIRASCG
ncbi:LacI family DNA-binding transcriptional regulator [Paraglaciecola agarilytica]|uniref:LacI family DNA-binding transcriptional regulator n=1 Tax=Paraglaciecola chathamensis TaxID=368405 RepID=UPI001C09380D|nr:MULTISPECIES: LacI family DNA-binding transcriptional regulator [Paraglaciecola]MBU3016806.1 LacI family DNA-binding transcriptional regulator [Paraglaciecola agarilytica]MDO6559723.1 LacI family DNA-binding transcriptional regulator [Paraglaciecola chathamensis]